MAIRLQIIFWEYVLTGLLEQKDRGKMMTVFFFIVNEKNKHNLWEKIILLLRVRFITSLIKMLTKKLLIFSFYDNLNLNNLS